MSDKNLMAFLRYFKLKLNLEGFEPSTKRRVFKHSTYLVRWSVFEICPDKKISSLFFYGVNSYGSFAFFIDVAMKHS